jgi:hypothetical protein
MMYVLHCSDIKLFQDYCFDKDNALICCQVRIELRGVAGSAGIFHEFMTPTIEDFHLM